LIGLAIGIQCSADATDGIVELEFGLSELIYIFLLMQIEVKESTSVWSRQIWVLRAYLDRVDCDELIDQDVSCLALEAVASVPCR
jgi:hypothetical protein